jgi:AcrR family transcriptional regulator
MYDDPSSTLYDVSTEAVAPIWVRPEPGSRRPRFTRERIAAAALAIADAEGIDAVSMRRVAAELDAGTMTLYHYVRNKGELFALMDDAIMGELLIPDGELPGDWRAALTEIACRSRAAFKRHPWALQGLKGAQGGPNSLKHIEQSLAAVAGLDVDATTQLEIIGMVDDYAFGFAIREQEVNVETFDHDGFVSMLEYFDSLVRSGEFPNLQRLRGDDDVRSSWDRIAAVVFDEGRFDRGLSRLLDGIALDLERRGSS